MSLRSEPTAGREEETGREVGANDKVEEARERRNQTHEMEEQI